MATVASLSQSLASKGEGEQSLQGHVEPRHPGQINDNRLPC